MSQKTIDWGFGHCTTTDGVTAVAFTMDAAIVSIPSGASASYKVFIAGRNTSTNVGAGGEYLVVAHNNAGTVTLDTATPVAILALNGAAGLLTGALSVVAGSPLAFKMTGVASTTIEWSVKIEQVIN